MSYQYLFCATCGQRRIGRGYRCSVCDSLLRRPEADKQHRAQIVTLVRAVQDAEVGQPIAA